MVDSSIVCFLCQSQQGISFSFRFRFVFVSFSFRFVTDFPSLCHTLLSWWAGPFILTHVFWFKRLSLLASCTLPRVRYNDKYQRRQRRASPSLRPSPLRVYRAHTCKVRQRASPPSRGGALEYEYRHVGGALLDNLCGGSGTWRRRRSAPVSPERTPHLQEWRREGLRTYLIFGWWTRHAAPHPLAARCRKICQSGIGTFVSLPSTCCSRAEAPRAK